MKTWWVQKRNYPKHKILQNNRFVSIFVRMRNVNAGESGGKSSRITVRFVSLKCSQMPCILKLCLEDKFLLLNFFYVRV